MLPGILSFSCNSSMVPFTEYASEKRILELIIKERVKVALKDKLQNVSPVATVKKAEQDGKMTIAEQVFMLMPARDSWCRPRRKERMQSDSDEPRSTKQILTRSLALTINKHRKEQEQRPYLQRLDKFIASIREDIADDRALTFESIKIVGKKKKVDADGTIIMRPLCIFDSLREKLLIALASKYLSEVFDPLLHEEILSYRPLRHYHNSAAPLLTDRENAIENLQHYRAVHKHERIYVAECDIQKYFDTINHDVIRRCFEKFAEKLKSMHPSFDYRSVGRIVEAYLDSYSFYKNVIDENERLKLANPPRKIETPNEQLFMKRGCYSEEEFRAASNKIGIPQGGALSGLISNVVLSTIDRESIIERNDCNRFFCRYGDDVMLMHTSRKECERLINEYCKKLTDYKLLYHEFISVADARFRKSDGAVRPSLWEQKSRSPFLWGRSPGEKEQVDWVGFLGYEIRYTGEVRLRRSSLNDKFRNIKRKYRVGAKTIFAKGKSEKKSPEETSKQILNRIERFKSDGLATAKSLNCNKYSTTQALKLTSYASKWLYRLLYKIARRNNLTDAELAHWWRVAKESDTLDPHFNIKNRQK